MFENIKYNLQPSYDTNIDDINKDFYVPILSEAIVYKRVSCYFSSKSLSMYSTGLEKFAENGGYMQLIISEDVSKSDYSEIIAGYKAKSSAEELSDEEKRKLGNLAYLIANNKADVKIGFIDNGIFHSKWGIFKDKFDNIIYFNGSNNETYNAITRNYESFDVDVSWDNSSFVQSRINDRIKKFDLLWENKFQGIKVVDITDTTYELIKQYDKGKIIPMANYDNALILDMKNNEFFFVDNTDGSKTSKPSFIAKFDAFINKDKGYPYFSEDTNYITLEKIISIAKKLAAKREFDFLVGTDVIDFINKKKYSIEEYRKTGLTLKDRDRRWKKDFDNFIKIVQDEVTRPLLHRQLEASFYMVTQKRAANFSVPGAGKTAMVLGAFAYLNSKKTSSSIKRILVICPKNAFDPWKDEFKTVFGPKKELRLLSVQEEDVRNNKVNIENSWLHSNLILVNYEATKKYKDSIIKCLKFDNETMLVFDEVHRIKGLASSRAAESLEISRYADYKYVLTGTPIPNSYQDIFNFLKIMYYDEYDKHFGYTPSALKNPDDRSISEINERLSPYFWRINKEQLNVPAAEEDNIITVAPSEEQLLLAEKIYLSGQNALAIIIRMIQLSTNPGLIKKNIDLKALGYNFENDVEDDFVSSVSGELSVEIQKALNKSIIKDIAHIDVDKVKSPKFEKGIDLIKYLVSKNKKVMVWALFIDTIEKINDALRDDGINAMTIYGATDTEERAEIIKKFKQESNEIQVLISNPNTLGEAVSLHKTVHDAVYFEFNYNLTFMLQSRDRIHRLGLEPDEKTNYYFLMTESEQQYFNFIDRKIYESLKIKELRMKDAIDKNILKPEITDDELEEARRIVESEKKFNY